jgi:hypothetical protein
MGRFFQITGFFSEPNDLDYSLNREASQVGVRHRL